MVNEVSYGFTDEVTVVAVVFIFHSASEPVFRTLISGTTVSLFIFSGSGFLS